MTRLRSSARRFTTRATFSLVGAATILAVFSAFASTSGAATQIVEPQGNPYHVGLDAQGKPLAFTVVATGFQPGRLVFLEQCNGRVPADPHWSPTLDCDLGGAPPPALVDASGKATFATTDSSRRFAPFVGASPSGLFNCVTPGGSKPSNGLQNFTTCQLRVSSNNTTATADQAFLSMVFGGSSSSSSTSVWLIVLGVAIVVLAGIGAFFLFRRRHTRQKSQLKGASAG